MEQWCANHYGVTFEHIRYDSAVMDEIYKSDNIAAFLQYDQRFGIV